MATKTTKTKKQTLKAKRYNKDVVVAGDLAVKEDMFQKPRKSRPTVFWVAIIAVLAVAAGLGLAFPKFKKHIIVAMVNGKPLFTNQLTTRLTDRFGGQMLEAMIGEQLILDEAKRNNATVTPEEITKKVTEIEGNLGGAASLEQSLSLQGISKEEFQDQIKMQLLIDKMLSGEVSVSATEVDEYITTAGVQLTATTPAEKKIEAEKQLRETKISQKFVEWFNALKEKAKVERFL